MSRKHQACYFLFIVVGFINCNNESVEVIPAHAEDLENLIVYSLDETPMLDMRLTREQTFGDTSDIYISRLADVTVDDRGRVYIADGEQLDIKVFESDGGFLNLIGRPGEGPGEFLRISNMQTTNGILAVYDSNVRQSVWFSSDNGEYIRTIPLADNRNSFQDLQDFFLSDYYLKPDHRFTALFLTYKRGEDPGVWGKLEKSAKVFSLDSHGNIDSEEFFETYFPPEVIVPFNDMYVGSFVDIFDKLLISLSDNDQIFLAQTEDFLIEVYSPEGEYLYAFYYPVEKIPLTRATAADAEIPGIFIDNLHNIDTREHWYVLNALLVDDENRLWVSTIVENFDIYEWWVLEETGELITKFEWPRDEPIEVIKNGCMYTRETDEETGLQQIVRYRVEMKSM